MAITISKSANRPKKTTAELLALISQRHEDWWPEEFHLTIARSGEHDWTVIVDSATSDDLVNCIGPIVAELRSRNAWVGR